MERYVFLVKNLRGVFTASDGDDIDVYVQWLTRRYRYRDIGIVESFYRRYTSILKNRVHGNPFHVLSYPTNNVKAFAEHIANLLISLELPDYIAESLLFAASYASPIITTTRAINLLSARGLAIYSVASSCLDDSSAKLHLRIANYSVLDSYVETISFSVECAQGKCSPIQLRHKLLEYAKHDSKRYWRLRADEPSTTTIVYIDYASIVLSRAPDLAETIAETEARILLPMLVAFNLDSLCISDTS